MVSVSHVEGFDYLAAANGVFDRLLDGTATRIRFLARSGFTIIFEGTGLRIANGDVNGGVVTAVRISDSSGNILASLTDLSIGAARLFDYFQEGNAFPHLLWGHDTIRGTAGADMLEGYERNDTIYGYDGDDLLGGGAGDDTLVPGSGNDRVYGGDDEDTMVLAGNRADWAVTMAGRGGTAVHLATGETKIFYGVEFVQFDDELTFFQDFPGVIATAVDGIAQGSSGIDVLTGTTGNDYLNGRGGEDRLEGGAGDDIYSASHKAAIVEDADGGFDHLNYSGYSVPFTLPDNVESVAPVDFDNYTLTGNALDNTMFGESGVDWLQGLDGDDTLFGAAKRDFLYGGAGSDTLLGGSGNDYLEGDTGDDYSEGGGGADEIWGGDGNDVIHGDVPGARDLASLPVATAAPTQASATNILFVVIDELAPLFSMFPQATFQAVAPNFEAFLAASTNFTSAYVNAPVCNASRASVLLGVSPETSGVFNNYDSLVAARSLFQSLPSHLQDLGYTTYATGKVFNDNAGQGDPSAWTGFDRTWTRVGDWQPATWERRTDPVSNSGGADVPDRAFADGRAIDVLTNFLGANQSAPFFFALGQYLPHEPSYVPQRYFDLYPLDSIEIPAWFMGDRDDLGRIARAYANQTPAGVLLPDSEGRVSGTDELGLKLAIQGYLASVSYADAIFGQALAALKASPHAANTAIVMWGDNGFHLGEKDHFSKFTLWEKSLHVPLAIQLPGQTEGTTVASPVDLLGLYKTIADILNVGVPSTVEGISLFPLLQDPSLAWDHPVVSTLDGNYSVRSADYRYILYWDGSEELYDHRVDPQELTNLAADPASRSIMDALRAYLPGSGDILSGDAGDDTIYGEVGDDVIYGGDGDDLLYGGVGDDEIHGGADNDRLFGEEGDDRLEGAGRC